MILPNSGRVSNGIVFALAAALLFGGSMPLAKQLLGTVHPVLLAGLLYLGSALGLSIWQCSQAIFHKGPQREASLRGSALGWLAGAILCGGIAGPVLLMLGLRSLPASSASLLLNLEGVLTAVLAWLFFKENYDRRLILGMFAIAGGGVLLSWQGTAGGGLSWGAPAIVAACLMWAVDNNLTGKVSAGDPIQIATLKGVVAGVFNCILAFCAGAVLPAPQIMVGACLVGLFGYGVSLMLFVLALRHIGTARTSAYFSIAPFVGSVLSVLFLKDATTPAFLGAAALMSVGVWLHLTERHEHIHVHEELQHEHSHLHDEHHQHEHESGSPEEEPHSHPHTHQRLLHSHPHYPDIHHHHDH